jgi:hypothetical protein
MWLLSVCVIHGLLLVSRLPQLPKTILKQGVARGIRNLIKVSYLDPIYSLTNGLLPNLR